MHDINVYEKSVAEASFNQENKPIKTMKNFDGGLEYSQNSWQNRA